MDEKRYLYLCFFSLWSDSVCAFRLFPILLLELRINGTKLGVNCRSDPENSPSSSQLVQVSAVQWRLAPRLAWVAGSQRAVSDWLGPAGHDLKTLKLLMLESILCRIRQRKEQAKWTIIDDFLNSKFKPIPIHYLVTIYQKAGQDDELIAFLIKSCISAQSSLSFQINGAAWGAELGVPGPRPGHHLGLALGLRQGGGRGRGQGRHHGPQPPGAQRELRPQPELPPGRCDQSAAGAEAGVPRPHQPGQDRVPVPGRHRQEHRLSGKLLPAGPGRPRLKADAEPQQGVGHHQRDREHPG